HGEGAHRHRHGLGAGIAAHRGDDGHEHGKGDHLVYGRAEQADHVGHSNGSDQVYRQPGRTAANGVDGAVGDVLVADTSEEQDIFLRLLLDDVDDVVDGDHADKTPALVHHAHFHQIIALEVAASFFLVLGGVNGDEIGVHQR